MYYRLRLGLNGFSPRSGGGPGPLVSEDRRFLPSPMQGEGLLLLRVPASGQVDLRTRTRREGRCSTSGLRGGRHAVRLPNAQAGTYFYDAVSGDRRFRGRFVLVR